MSHFGYLSKFIDVDTFNTDDFIDIKVYENYTCHADFALTLKLKRNVIGDYKFYSSQFFKVPKLLRNV